MNHLVPFVIQNWYLVVLLIVLIVAYLALEFRDRSHGVAHVSPQRAVILSNREKATYIDVRPQAAFEEGHIADAIHAPGGELAVSPVVLKKLKKSPVIVVCQKGISAKPAAAKLKKEGFEAYVLSGGLTAWKQDQMPLVKSSN